MTTAPFLVRDGEWTLDVSVGGGRRRFSLTDRAESLLVADLDYDNRDVVPWVLVKGLVLGGDAFLDEPGYDPLRMGWNITGADGGRDATAEELAAFGEHLRSKPFGEDEHAALQEHVKATGLVEHVDPGEVRSRADRVRGLQDIARNLDG